MPLVLPRVNMALDINPPGGESVLTVNGSNWLWAVTAVFCIDFLIFFVVSFIARAGEKVFHYLFIIALLVGTISYYAQASDLAWSVIKTSNQLQNGATRQIFFAKYVYWMMSFPVMSVALGLLSGISWATIFYNVTLCWIWVLSYLFAAYTESNYKWGFFGFGTTAYIFLAFCTLEAHRSASRIGLSRDYLLVCSWTNILWLNYPLAWGLTDGGNRLGITPMFIWFGILDVLMVPLLCYIFLILSRNWDYGRMNIAFTQYGRVNVHDFPEKPTKPAGGPAASPAVAAA